jgi:hypothetical protein
MEFNDLEHVSRTLKQAHGHSTMNLDSVARQHMHTPVPDPFEDEDDPEIKRPPVPPDREDEIVPQRDPPKPGRDREPPPMIA